MQKNSHNQPLNSENWIQPNLQAQHLYPDKIHYIAKNLYVI